jgi:hypothetical protein
MAKLKFRQGEGLSKNSFFFENSNQTKVFEVRTNDRGELEVRDLTGAQLMVIPNAGNSITVRSEWPKPSRK